MRDYIKLRSKPFQDGPKLKQGPKCIFTTHRGWHCITLVQYYQVKTWVDESAPLVIKGFNCFIQEAEDNINCDIAEFGHLADNISSNNVPSFIPDVVVYN